MCQIGLVTSRPLQILLMFTVDEYPRLLVWKFMKLDIESNINSNHQQSENYDCDGHNGILMRVCDQNVVSGFNIATAPIISISASRFHGMFVEFSPPRPCLDNSKIGKYFIILHYSKFLSHSRLQLILV